MKQDRWKVGWYSKVILTVIAICLAGLTVKQLPDKITANAEEFLEVFPEEEKETYSKVYISEKEGLLTLIQVYQNQESRWNSASMAVGIGLLVIPLFVLGVSLDPHREKEFPIVLRLLCFFLTLILAVSAVFLVTKTIYLGAILRESLMRLEVANKGNLVEYIIETQAQLRNKYPVFNWFRKMTQEEEKLNSLYQREFWSLSIIGCSILTLILFSFIWWRETHFWFKLLGSEALFVALVWVLFRSVGVT